MTSTDMASAEVGQGLKKATRCHFCGEQMQAGDAVSWYKKSAFRASKHHTIPARWVAHHPHNCIQAQREKEQARQQEESERRVAAMAACMVAGDMEGALAVLTGAA